MTAQGNPEGGFSLIEVWVALAIIALAGVSLIELGERHVDRLERLETQLLADLVAGNALAELRLGHVAPGGLDADVALAGRTWRVTHAARPTGDPDLVDIEIRVASDTGTEATLRAFIDAQAAP